MARKDSKAKKYIEHLLDKGYEAKDIAKISGIPRSTVYHIVDKLRTEARLDFDELMEKDYLYKYRMNLDNYSKTIRECNEEIEQIHKKYDELERIAKESLENVDPSKDVSKANYIANLVAINNSRSNDLVKLVQQRDRASELKARLFNQGPLVYKVNMYVQQAGGKGTSGHPMFESAKNEIIVEQLPKQEIPKLEEAPVMTDEDVEILKEMEEDNFD